MSASQQLPIRDSRAGRKPERPTFAAALSLIGGILTAMLGAIFWWAWSATLPEFGPVHMLAIFATSCLIGPVSIITVILAVRASNSERRRLIPVLAVALCSTGIIISLVAWSIQS